MVDSLPLGGQLYQYAKYYVTCATTDPLAQPASDVGSSLSSLASNLAPIVTACVGDAAVASAQAGSVAANARLVDLNTFRACPVIQSKIIASLGDGVCKNVFSGFFGVWLCFFCSLPCLFITLATAAVIYEYFDVKYWMAAEANAHLLTWQTTEAPVVPEPILEKDEKVVDAIEGHAIEITDDKNDV